MKNVITVFLLFVGLSLSAQFKLGAGLNYTSFRAAWGVQLKTSIPVGDKWKIGGTGDFFVVNDRGWDLNVDAQYQLIEFGQIPILPFAGLNFTSLEETDFNVGMNIGVLSFFPITDTLDLYIEPKYLLISSANNGMVYSAGVFLKL